MTPVKTTVIPAPPLLQRDVECFNVVEVIDAPAHSIHVAPAGVSGIVFQHIDGQPAIDRIVSRSGRTTSTPTLFLYGPGLDPGDMHFKAGSYITTQVIFKPHALRSLFGLNALTLTNDAIDLDEFTVHALHERLLDAPDPQTHVRLLTDFLVARLAQIKSRDALIEHRLRRIRLDVAGVTVKSLRDELSLSERQFERRFSQSVGLGPQAFIRVQRFNQALRMIQSRQYRTLTEVAHALNFYDQSHFIREVRAFSGYSPKDLSRLANTF